MINAKEITLTLNGAPTTFRVQQLPARSSLKLLHRLAKHISPALGPIALGGLGMDVTQMGLAVESALRTLAEGDVDYLTEHLMEGITVKGQPLSGMFDVLFAGETKNIFKLWKFMLEVNYSDFFGDLKNAVANLQQTAGSQSQSQTPLPPNGGSGALS